MINKKKWIDTLPKTNTEINFSYYDHHKIINANPENHTYNSLKKYSLMTILFVFGLLFVSALKNETRNLQKEINRLKTSINSINFDLEQAVLDNAVITSPENISLLAKEYLSPNLVSYKKSQIGHYGKKIQKHTKKDHDLKKKITKTENKNLQASIKNQILKEIEKKKAVKAKVKKIYSDPKSIPNDVKNKISKEVKEKKTGLKKILENPKDVFTVERVGRWGAIQVVKVFLGVPLTPGK
tara:strand:- start:531 stop:1250 length:720 start_codon:yes stop_codon:yes gene_type:complete